MSRLQKIFAQQKPILNVYCTAGFPHPESTMDVMLSLQEFGADMIELGIPYSDPLADGPVIQESNATAIKNGMSIQKLFVDIKTFREKIHLPVILMGYLNPVLQYGFEKFCQDAAAIGIDGLVIPDLPDTVFEKQYAPIIKKYKLDFIFLVTPETTNERIKKLDRLSSGFLYAVSSSATTGNTNKLTDINAYLQRFNALSLHNPVLVGFGIGNKEMFMEVNKLAAGAIIGSAYIKAIRDAQNVNTATKSFLSSILG
ncbi:MAG: tryptophan synthase subunit alpha [Chitinophagaceae bacterium]